jgi:hypothetical protein
MRDYVDGEFSSIRPTDPALSGLLTLRAHMSSRFMALWRGRLETAQLTVTTCTHLARRTGATPALPARFQYSNGLPSALARRASQRLYRIIRIPASRRSEPVVSVPI